MEHDANELEVQNKHITKGYFLGVRYVQAVLLFLNFVVLYLNRIHVAITLVAMTNTDKSNTNFPEYNWNELQKSYILSSFYWGYVLTQFPGVYFTRLIGVKINLFTCSMGSGLFSLLVPFCVPWGGWRVFCLLRFLQGLFQGGFYPATLQHLANWSPPMERTLLAGITHTGFDLGSIAAMGLSGVIAISSLGWPGIFYIYAALCFLWCALWQLLGANDTSTSRFITKEERLYIEDSLKNSVNFEKKRLQVPWRAISRSKPFYALLIVRCASLGGVVTLQAEWPSYMNGVFKLNIKENALYSALPFVISCFSAYFFTLIANFITQRHLLSLTTARKCFNSLGMWVPAIGSILIGFINETHKHLAFITMILVTTFHNSTNMGSILIPIDMAPNHTGLITSIVNTVSNSLVLLGPLYVGLIVKNEQNRFQWQIAFTTIAVVLCVGDLVFLIWGTAKQQTWNAAEKGETQTKIQPNRIIETSFDYKSHM